MPSSRRTGTTQGQTVELRFEIKPEGNYTNTLYTIRYFQYDGEGSLKLVDGPVLVNNDRVLLESKTFRLNYTARSSEAHKFLIVIEDNFGSTPWEQTFEFNGKSGDDDDGGDTPGIWGEILCENFEHGGFSGAVFPDEPDAVARAHPEGYFLEQISSAKRNRQIVYIKHLLCFKPDGIA